MNKIILIGNLTRDPELRTTPNGYSVCDFTIAVNDRRGRSQQAGAQQDTAQFFRVSAWRQLGENCQRYLTKGSKVFVTGPKGSGCVGQDQRLRRSKRGCRPLGDPQPLQGNRHLSPL